MIRQPKIEKVELKVIKFLEFNRAVKMKQVDKLLHSMTSYGQLRLPVLVRSKITGADTLYCVDAQHMITALVKAGETVTPAIVIDTTSVKEIVSIMAVLNNVVSTWSVDDYVNAFCSLNLQGYMSLRAHKFATGFNYTISAMILGDASSAIIKNGKFKTDCSDADIMTKYVVDVTSFLGTNNSKFMKAYIKFCRASGKKYIHKVFMNKIAQYRDKLAMVHDEGAMRNQLNSIYNK